MSVTLKASHFSDAAITVCKTLKDKGYDGYIVGGAVRDVLLDIEPKDFDIATNATPEQIVPLFKRARIIGRRFKIVHIYIGRELIEVTTFRAPPTDNPSKLSTPLATDNRYGSIEEDALRRDFTINALYYDPIDDQLVDLCNAMQDFEKRKLHVIGDIETRFKEDPVRMLRALRLYSKLPIDIDPEIIEHIKAHKDWLHHVSKSRLFDEVLKLFMHGYAYQSFINLSEFGLLNQLIACSNQFYPHNDIAKKFYHLALHNSDDRIRQGKSTTPSFLFAVFMWPDVQQQFQHLCEQQPDAERQQLWFHSMLSTLAEQERATTIIKRHQIAIREIWSLQHRLETQIGKQSRAKRTLVHPRFRAAFDFLLLRENAGEIEAGAGQWWQDMQHEHKDWIQSQRAQFEPKKKYHPKNSRSKKRSSKSRSSRR